MLQNLIFESHYFRALHDPCACHALVLYTPPEMPIGVIKIDQKDVRVHVVVDPVLGMILRPHQREGVKFMYDCVVGNNGEYQGCIMADEMVNRFQKLK